jgi:heptaprenyl diphosphate synthase
MPMPEPGKGRTGGERGDIALLGALCLYLSAVEYLIPKPLPFMRIGIANLPLMLALDIFPFGSFLLLAAIKILGQALVTGTLFSYVFLFSLAGTLLSAVSMYGARRLLGPRLISFAGTGCLGAMASNIIQLFLARLFVFGESARYIAPPFLAAGLVCGFALGLFCGRFTGRSRWYAERTGRTPHEGCAYRASRAGSVSVEGGGALPEKRADIWRRRRREWFDGLFPDRALCAAVFVIMPSLFFNPDTGTRALQFLFFWFLAWLSGKKNNPLITMLIITVIVFFNLLVPYGKVIASLGLFRITAGALLAGIHRAVTLEALVMLSRAAIRPGLKLPGAFGEVLGESFRVFGQITERKFPVNSWRGIRDISAGIDRLMRELSADAPDAASSRPGDPASGKPLTLPALASLVLVALVSWLLLFAGMGFIK